MYLRNAFTYHMHSFYFAFILNISYCASPVSRVFFLFLTMVFSISLRVQVLNMIILGSEEFKIMTRGKRFGRSPDKKNRATVVGGFTNKLFLIVIVVPKLCCMCVYQYAAGLSLAC